MHSTTVFAYMNHTDLARHDHAWIFGQRILLEMIAFYATGLVEILENGLRHSVVCRQLHVIHVPFTDHLISSHLSPSIYPIFRCCQTSGTSDLPDFSLLPDVCHQRFIRLFAAARRLAAATPLLLFTCDTFTFDAYVPQIGCRTCSLKDCVMSS